MKKLFFICMTLALIGCGSSIRVSQDYNPDTDFNQYKTYAFFKPGIDEVELSDLDKKRVLRALERELAAKGFSKSTTPDVMISFFTKSEKEVDVYNNYGYGYGAWGWGGMGYYGNNVSTTNKGILYIDVIDANKKELVWQGVGSSTLYSETPQERTEFINEMVGKILSQYYPQTSN